MNKLNLLFISNLSNNIDAGLNWSVPASINAQQRYDNVLWIDLTLNAFQEHWSKVKAYHNIQEYGGILKLEVLPLEFKHPDCVIFEGFYYMSHVKFAMELKKNSIPYIIIPRGSLTTDAFHNGDWKKYIKKKVAHWLIFNKYIRNAVSIQYLTQTEEIESKKLFHTSSFILPNGYSTPSLYKTNFSKNIKAVFIGRQDIYQKGLDLLLEAVKEIKQDLRNVGFFLDIYGPPRYDVKRVTEMISELHINDLVKNHEKGISGKEKENVLLSADLFILTSRFEGHPMGLIEALSYGLPVFISRGANMYEEIIEYKAGWACETNKNAIIQTLRQIVNEKKQFNYLSINARLLARKYNWNILAEKFHNEVSSIISKCK